MIKAFLSTLVFTFILLCGQAQAVEFVYRVDSRPPNVVFRDGFHSHGNNRALIPHLRGDSCTRTDNPDSIYIATSGSVEAVNNVARGYLRSPAWPRMYRYRIRADNNFYNARTSYEDLYYRTGEFDATVERMLGIQDEYVALTYIGPENIMEAVELTFDEEHYQLVEGAGQSNAAYIARSTQSNPGVIPNLPVPSVSFRERIVAIGALCTACFSSRGVRDDGGARSTRYDESILFYDARPVLESLAVQ